LKGERRIPNHGNGQKGHQAGQSQAPENESFQAAAQQAHDGETNQVLRLGQTASRTQKAPDQQATEDQSHGASAQSQSHLPHAKGESHP